MLMNLHREEKRLTGLLSTATMMSPRTILPAKPLVVGSNPAFAATLFPGTYRSSSNITK